MAAINAGNYSRAFFAPIGNCIYCGSADGAKKLSSEHIFPYFLGGDAELLDSSCERCARITSYLEGYCANKVFHSLRHKKGIHTRRPKNRPSHLEVEFLNETGLVKRNIPIFDVPYLLMLPHFEMPKILINQKPEGGVEANTYSILTDSNFNELVEGLRKPGDTAWRISTPLYRFDVFARFIAKVALAGAVAMLGFDPSKSYLGQMVLGTDINLGALIGCEPSDNKGIVVKCTPPLESNSDSHQLGFQHWGSARSKLLVAEIRFFVGHGNEIKYIAVVGPGLEGEVESHIKYPIR